MKRVVATLLLVTAAPAGAETLIGIRESNFSLVSFDSADPGTLTGSVATHGFPTGTVPISIDFRPATSTLYVVGLGPADERCRLFTVDPDSGDVSAVGAAYDCPATGNNQGEVDVDPVNDELRVLSGPDNYVVDLTDGTATAATDTDFAVGDPNAADTPAIGGAAYDRSTSGATDTTLYAIETGNGVLVRVGDANDGETTADGGELATVGSLGLGAMSGDFGFDISGASGTAYLVVFDTGDQRARLHTVNLATGAASAGEDIGTSALALLGVTVAPGVTLPDGDGEDDLEPLGGAPGTALLAVLALAARLRRRCG